MREYGEYPIKHPKPPAALETKKNPGLPSGPQGGLRDALCRAYPLGHTDPSPAFVFYREGWTALHYAACYGHLPAVRALINAGAPLHIETDSEGFLGGLAF